MSIRRELESLVLCKADERGMVLTSEELRNATNGVEYWFDETVSDSIGTALDNVMSDRENGVPFVVVQFTFNTDSTGTRYEAKFYSPEEYDTWFDRMIKDIDLLTEQFR